MKILQLVNTLSAVDGGPARNSFELNQALNAIDGCSATIVSVRDGGSASVASIDRENGRVLVGDTKPRYIGLRTSPQSLSLRAFVRQLREYDVVLLHGYYLWWTPLAVIAAARRRVAVALTPHGSLTSYDRSKKALKKKIYDAVVGRSIDPKIDVFVTGSSRELRELREGRPFATVAVGGVGVGYVRTDEVAQPPSERATIQLLSVSRIAAKKRIDLMIDAVAATSEIGLDARLIVAGSGDSGLESELRRHAARSGVESRVEFVGHLTGEEKDALMRKSHIFLMPSDDENFGIALAEALRAGLPAVVSLNVGAADELESRGVVVLPECTGRAIGAAVRELSQPAEWRASSAAAQSAAREVFDWQSVAQNWSGILSSARRVD